MDNFKSENVKNKQIVTSYPKEKPVVKQVN